MICSITLTLSKANDADTTEAFTLFVTMFIAPDTIKDSLLSIAFNNEVPFTVKSPFTVNEPLVTNEPVNTCVSSCVSPNFVEPELKRIDDDTTDTLYSSAVKVPLILTEPVTSRLFVV